MANSDYKLPFNSFQNFVPKNLRNEASTALLSNLFDRFMTRDESVPFYGYIGQRPTSTEDFTPRVPAANVERDVNSLVPVFTFKVGAETVAFTVQDLVKKAEALGISTENWSTWLYSQGNNFLPPIDIDKFANFSEYFWVAKALESTPTLSWNPGLEPEYYTIAKPKPTDLVKLNVVAATTEPIVLTGTGVERLSFEVRFSTPTQFTITPIGTRTYPTSQHVLTSFDEQFSYSFNLNGSQVTLLQFNIQRDPIINSDGQEIGRTAFAAGDTFTISPTFISKNYVVSFSGGTGAKGKITKVRALSTYQQVDGVSLKAGDRVLVKNANPQLAGIYVVKPGEWVRAADFDTGTASADAAVYVTGGAVNGGKLFKAIAGAGGGFGWVQVPNGQSNTNDWQEGNFWVRGSELATLGLDRYSVIQASRPIIEFDSVLQLNSFVDSDGKPAASGTSYQQRKTSFNQVPLFDLFRYDETHSGLVSPIFFYVEDSSAAIDPKLQRRVKRSTNDSADFVFNHGCVDPTNGSLLFFKLRSSTGSQLKTVWHAGYISPEVVDVTFSGEGNGSLQQAIAFDFSQQQIWTIRAESPTVFTVIGSKTGEMAKATVGLPYPNGEISFVIQAGSTPFAVDDTFTVRLGNLELPRYMTRDAETGALVDLPGGPAADLEERGAWQVPRTFYNNPYNEVRGEIDEGVVYSHFRSILGNQVKSAAFNPAFGGSIKLWSEQQTLLASLLMQRDLTPISVIDLAQRQYETGLNSIRDLFEKHAVDYIAGNGPVDTVEKLDALLDFLLAERAKDSDVRTVLYDSTAGVVGFPITLPQLGLLPLVSPTIEFDTVLGRMLLVHHDGHRSPLFEDSDDDFRTAVFGSVATSTQPANPSTGTTWVKPNGTSWVYDGTSWVQFSAADLLNSVMLRVEKRLHAGINPNTRIFDVSALLGDSGFQDQLKRELFTFAAINAYDPLGPDFDSADAFTWNYSRAEISNFAPVSTTTVPARWHRALVAHQRQVTGVLETVRPNLEPWKLLGYEDGLEWWNSLTSAQRAEYTPAVNADAIDGTFIQGGTVKVVQTQLGATVLSGAGQVIDGVSVQVGDRVLLQNELSPSLNGVWVVQAGGWLRDSSVLVENTVINVTGGRFWKDTTWVVLSTPATVSDPVNIAQARLWSTRLWADVQAARPGLKLSVNTANDTLLPPYVSAASPHSVNALTTVIPPGRSLGYNFGEDSPVEAVWKRTLEYGYSLARALFRFDPLAFLGFTWGFNWVNGDGVLYDSALSMPGHRRLALHGEAVSPVDRENGLVVTGAPPTAPFTVTYTAYDENRNQNFTVTDGTNVVYVREGPFDHFFNGVSFRIEDHGVPFKMGDRFEIDAQGAVTFVPSVTNRIHGFGQVFTHALRESSIDTSSGYAIAALREWDVKMGYRAGGLVSSQDLSVFTDSETLSPAAYTLLFKRNPCARNEWLHALRVSVQQVGQFTATQAGYVPTGTASDWVFRIEGYNPRYLSLRYDELSGERQTFYALAKEHTPLAWTQPTVFTENVVEVNLPITITGLQNVADFLFGYCSYLERQGWEFNRHESVDTETGRIRNFQLEIEKLIDRVYSGITLDQGHIVNPFIDKAWFRQDTGLLAEFIDSSLFDVTGHPGVFDVMGMKYSKSDISVLRTRDEATFSAAGPMFSAHVQVDEFEHLFIFNNFARPSTKGGLLYDPFSGARVVTYKFKGRRQPGLTLRPEFGGHYLVGHEVHQNLQASTDNVARFYDPNFAFENEQTTRHAFALLGFNEKDYFNSLDISSKSQFNFWRGLIQAKGTNMTVDAYLNNNRFDDAKVDEYWAYKVAEYGDARTNELPELKLTAQDALTQFTQLIFDPLTQKPAGFESFTEISSQDDTRWFSIDDLGTELNFPAEEVGKVTLVGKADQQVTLPFVADWLEPAGSQLFTKLNDRTILVHGDVTVTGFGPAKSRFDPVKLFNYVDNELVADIPMWHPAAGIHTPAALESINIISKSNPAKFNRSTLVENNRAFDPLRPWGENELGRVWLDTSRLAYVPYYDKQIFTLPANRLARWGALADYASIDVYEWVRSTVPPSEYDALALTQAGNADLGQERADGQAAGKQVYRRTREWQKRPIAWAYSPVPVAEIDWGARPPFGTSTSGNDLSLTLSFVDGRVVLSEGTFAQQGITAGMRIGGWSGDEVDPKPLSEYVVSGEFSKVLYVENALHTELTSTGSDLPVAARVSSFVTTSPVVGELVFTAETPVPIGIETDINGAVTAWQVDSVLKVTAPETGHVARVVVSSAIGRSGPVQAVAGDPGQPAAYLYGAVTSYDAGEVLTFELAELGLQIEVTVQASGDFPVDSLAIALEDALGAKLTVRDAVAVTPVVAGSETQLTNDATTGENQWIAWAVPTQDQLAADTTQPVSSWKPYVGDFAPIGGDLTELQEAASNVASPLTLNDGTQVAQYRSTWSDWQAVVDVKETRICETAAGTMVFQFSEVVSSERTSVYVNGVSRLRSSFSVIGSTVQVVNVNRGDEVTIIIRAYEPTAEELEFNPEVSDDYQVQVAYKQDYEYVAEQQRLADGTFGPMIYYFWVKNRSTQARGKKLSVQAIAQLLRTGPSNFITFQASDSSVKVYDAVSIAGLTNVVTKDDTFKLRFTRNYTLRDDTEELKRKNVHTEWALMRPGQKSKVPEKLWQKLTDSIAGQDAAGNSIPAARRELYDEKYGTKTQFGFGPEQALAPAQLLRASVIHTILNTQLTSISAAGTVVPDYVSFLDLDDPDSWFATPQKARETMTLLWNQGKIAQVNEIFFAVLHDILSSSYELTDIFKTSRLSAYSIKVVRPVAVVPTYE